MNAFTAHRLSVTARVVTPVALNTHKGSALRGALYHALRKRFCTMRDRAHECSACPLWQVCPVCTLVSTLSTRNRTGRDAARPYTIQPPLEPLHTRYEPGERLSFGLTLYADALRLFPYVIMALCELEEDGLGRKLPENGWRRGTVAVEQVRAENPLAGVAQEVMHRAPSGDSDEGSATVSFPDIPITHSQVMERAAALAAEKTLRVVFLTPARLVHRRSLVKPGEVAFPVLLGRLLDRLESLAQHHTDTPLALDYAALLERAEAVRTVDDRTRWVELSSYSTRQRRATPIGGLEGAVTFACDDWAPFAPWLVWGQFVHVGKDAVKGNGWYQVKKDEG